MCRVFGCVAAEPVSIRHELLEAENPLIRQSEEHDSGWGMAVYERADGARAALRALPRGGLRRRRVPRRHRHRAAASSTCTCAARPWAASRSRTRTRSASGSYSFGHNGTILRYPRLLEHRACAPPDGRHRLRALLQLPDARLRRGRPGRLAARGGAARPSSARPSAGSTSSSPTASGCSPTGSASSSCTGCARPGQLLVASERLTDEPWHTRPAGRAADARPRRPRGAPRRAPAWATSVLARARHPEGRRAGPPARRGTRGAAAARARGPGGSGSEPSVTPPLRAAREPGLRPAGGRSQALPAVHAELDRLGAQHRTVTTRSIEHADEEARRAAEHGRDRGRARRRRRCSARSRGALKAPRHARWRSSPAAAATTSRACSASPPTRRRPRELAVDGPRAAVDVADVDGTPFSASRASASTPTPTASPTRRSSIKGNAVYALRGPARARRLEARRASRSPSTASATT